MKIKITNLELEVTDDAKGDVYSDIQELKDEIKRIYSIHESIYYQHQNLTRIAWCRLKLFLMLVCD
ncbi:MAG: hypothetical protein KME29_12215 [Calothrix sp. FI2-JRJ7]|jgi:hypothetical protein|nr:hypothetical protein [Calothrix sp. FI2-JRJ7]